MIVVNVRGACGAGKSTLVRSYMNDRGSCEAIHVLHRRKPLGYIAGKGLFVPGHYEIQNGGLDTMLDLRAAHAWIRKYLDMGNDILFEGMNNRDDKIHLRALHDRRDVELHLVFVDLPLSECEAGFRAKGQSRSVDYVGVTHRKAIREIAEYRRLGYNVHVGDREQSAATVRRLFEGDAQQIQDF